MEVLGTLVAAATVGGVMMILNKNYRIYRRARSRCASGNAMAAVLSLLCQGVVLPGTLRNRGSNTRVLTIFGIPLSHSLSGCLIRWSLSSFVVGAQLHGKSLPDKDQIGIMSVREGYINRIRIYAGGALLAL